MKVVKEYNLQGKYKKLFDAKRGKFSLARSGALFELGETMPTFDTWEYFSSLGMLKITFSTAPSYLVEDDFFDCLEKHYDLADTE
jgi:hypothetical protein